MRILFLASSFTLFLGAGKSFQEINYKSYTLLLHSFAKNIEWPGETGKTSFIYGVYGNSKIMAELNTLAQTRKVRHMTIEVRTITTPAEAAGCDLVFVPTSRSSAIKEISNVIVSKPVLLVSERSGYCGKGAAISFTIDDAGALRFDISKPECERHKLLIKPQLLQIADRVY
ncbi:MAG: YfiR family protein [Bacteroidia bacterium]